MGDVNLTQVLVLGKLDREIGALKSRKFYFM